MSQGGKYRWERALLSSDTPAPIQGTLLVLASWADGSGGNCYPSIASLADRSKRTVRTVQRHLRIAEDAGWIRRSDRSRTGQANLYELLIPLPPQPVPPATGDAPTDRIPPDTGVVYPPPGASPNQPVNNQKKEPLPLTPDEEAAVALFVRHWGNLGTLKKRLRDQIAALPSRGWALDDLDWLASSNIDTARHIGALQKRMDRVGHKAPEEARADGVLQRMLTPKQQDGGVSASPGGGKVYAYKPMNSDHRKSGPVPI